MTKKNKNNSSTPSATAGGIKGLLQNAIEYVDKLHLALRDEQSALSNNNLPVFEKSVERKISHTGTLEAIEKSIFCLLDDSGYTMDKSGIADYIATCHNKTEENTIKALWKDLAKTLVECQKQNQINGRILNSASVNIRQALEILTGKRGTSKTYSSQGKQAKDDNSNSIAIA
ncbi:MAG: flagella synthesis protein FlgN [Thiohalomonadales bacterium]